jgi:hypothetical protein
MLGDYPTSSIPRDLDSFRNRRPNQPVSRQNSDLLLNEPPSMVLLEDICCIFGRVSRYAVLTRRLHGIRLTTGFNTSHVPENRIDGARRRREPREG